MIITKFIFENYGIYSGVQEIDLTPSSTSKNIILIGGTNGQGKTTLFDGILLCFYGAKFSDGRFNSKRAYYDFLKNMIHFNTEKDFFPNKSSIEIQFSHENLSYVDKYSVKRSWRNEEEKITESFIVKKNDVLLNDVSSDNWQDFINDLIPKGLSQLFFFDGEKIQNLAEDRIGNREFASSFKMLLGIDLIEKLTSDLKLYSQQQLKKIGATNILNEINALENQKNDIVKKTEFLIQDKSQLQTKLDSALLKIEKEEEKLMREGGLFSEKRNKLKEDLIKANHELESLKENLRSLCADTLPFAFSKQLSLKLQQRLQLEETHRQKNTAFSLMVNKKKKIIDELESKCDSPIEIYDILKQIFKNNSEYKLIHNLSIEENLKLVNLILEVSTDLPDILRNTTNMIIKKEKKILKTTREIEFAPDDSSIDPFLKQIKKHQTNYGEFKSQIKTIDEQISSLTFNTEKITKELDKKYDFIKNQEKLSGKLNTVETLQLVLKKYHKEVLKYRVEEFENLFLELYDILAKKKKAFIKVKLDPNDYSLTLYKSLSKTMDKNKLSEGEKQMYAISILWTLTKMAGRNLPFIIDTPMGRLDSKHRRKLVDKFFTSASKQVIILSTDTEIDREHYKALSPNISKDYLLDYSNGETKIKKGYYWKNE